VCSVSSVNLNLSYKSSPNSVNTSLSEDGSQLVKPVQVSELIGNVLRFLQNDACVSVARYQLAVTRFRDREETSSSIYLQNDPWDPTVTFENFIHNNENITSQDLVAWVTVGFLHIPHSEDIPNTSTPGNAAGFFLRPFNFFQEDPSVGSRSTVIVRPDGQSKVKIQRWTLSSPDICLSERPLTYNGSYLPD
ncbi:amiloride-sensitive amine oxidase [copper-containing]-like, partial [Chiloscyllium plagiosum]|uniref:amiloride-sensitive amine oxidase [copper-containing]-like n=1 Tax=Chiloscyllium plagiosum TaxID=36176 RepID=UPI001CB7D94F